MNETSITVKTNEIRPGDFLDVILPKKLHGPRGGRYRFAGVRVESRIVKIGPDERGRFVVTPSTGIAFVLPGNLADITEAKIRRSEATEAVKFMDDDALLVASYSDDRATKLAANAEIASRSRS